MRNGRKRYEDGHEGAPTPADCSGERTSARTVPRSPRLLMSRLGRVISLLSAHSVEGSLVSGVCATAGELLQVDGAGLALLANSSTICTHGGMAEVGEELQFTLGEGPCRDAMAGNVLVESDRIATDPRWPVFASGMAGTEAVSVAAFPVRVGGARVGALTVYRKVSGRLSADQAADGYVLAQVAAHVILAAQASVGGQGFLGEMEAGFVRMEAVHQATGMIMGQLGVGAEDALVRLRSTAFATGRPVIDFARDVIEGRAVLSDDEN